MALEVGTDGFADALMGLLKQYTDGVTEAVEREIEATAEAVCEEIKRAAPTDSATGKKRRRAGKRRYASTFTVKKLDTPAGESKFVIHNPIHYRRTHLLEFGHAKRGGGRVAGKPHILPGYDKVTAGLEDRIKKIIETGG